MFTLKELTCWFGVTVFELIVFLSSLFVYTIFLCLKVDGFVDINWYIVHAPLFLCDAFLFYFNGIVFIRACLEGYYRNAFFNGFWTLIQQTLILVIQLIICLKLESSQRVRLAEIWIVIIVYMTTLILKTCIHIH